jgi:undecaprenyl-diphosphatase
MRRLLHKFDHYFIKRIQSWPEGVRPLMKVASTTGFPFSTIGVGVMLVAFGLAYDARLPIMCGLAIWVTIAVGSVLKIWLRRPRPLTYEAKRWMFATFSFPSGHAAGAAIAYGSLVYIVVSLPFAIWSVPVVVALVSWIGLVGISRVYLGAHYPSDVIAGWLLGVGGIIALIVVTV